MFDNDEHTAEEQNPLGREPSDAASEHRISRRNRNLTLAILAGALAIALVLVILGRNGGKANGEPAASGEHAEEHHEGEGGSAEATEVELDAETLEAAGLETETVGQRPGGAPLAVTGTVESNQEQMQRVSALVSGRVDRVNAVLGDVVRAGEPLAIISSPEAAELKGKLVEAETRLALARRNVDRVRRAENRAAVVSAKARLDEAEATLKRTRRLAESGAGAGKDLTAAEAAYQTAKAEFDYQSNIAINREMQEAQAEVETAATEVDHLRRSLQALGGSPGAGNVSTVTLVAPMSGTIVERAVNAGAGIEAGSPLFTIADLSTVWVIANVPEALVGRLRVGAPAGVRGSTPGLEPRTGRIDYIDPRLDEQTRTARVRVEVSNPGERLKAGMFVRVDLESGGSGSEPATADGPVVPSAAIQRVGERAVVFLPKSDEPGHFEVRDVELGGEIDGYRRVLGGLEVGETVVTKGSFTLKTQLMKSELGEHGH